MGVLTRACFMAGACALVGLSTARPLAAQNRLTDDGPTLEVDRGLFSGWKYTYGGAEEASVYGFGGMSFTPEFEALLGRHPPALEAASRARPWNIMRFVGGLGMLTGAALILLDAIDDAGDVQGGDVPDSGSGDLGLGIAVGSLVVGAVGSVVGSGHLERGVAIFNEARPGDGGSAAGLVARPRASLTLTLPSPWR